MDSRQKRLQELDERIDSAFKEDSRSGDNDGPVKVTDPNWHASAPALRPYTDEDAELRESGEFDGTVEDEDA